MAQQSVRQAEFVCDRADDETATVLTAEAEVPQATMTVPKAEIDDLPFLDQAKAEIDDLLSNVQAKDEIDDLPSNVQAK